MTHTIQSPAHDQLQQEPTTTGRFARQVLTIESPDTAPVRSEKVRAMQARVQYRDYQIDNHVLAAAMIDRVSARGMAIAFTEQAV